MYDRNLFFLYIFANLQFLINFYVFTNIYKINSFFSVKKVKKDFQDSFQGGFVTFIFYNVEIVIILFPPKF